ncbi:TetR family transcriptional regulator [Colwellia sp. MT41]|uniref:Transcriptional regulator n=1 Tax=Colwellia marinimaniae TaxID=1513592 RepID=A0ABQ0MWC5_9GAMM|nr:MULTISPECIES: TetR/AcrR family transcriptional regulator [Colwellia]ALO33793.1 TetR family transcriptional regulator [Colwellia sp. MT41]GAW96668.1 transcriptional regulator [Colwellia marinimaniae]
MAKPVSEENETLSDRGLLIRDAAEQLFFQHGFDETSLEMIINETGGSRRSIYNEFGNKQGLLLAVVNRQVYKQAHTLTDIHRELSAKAALNDVCFRFAQGMLSPTMMSLFRLVVQQVVKFPELGEVINQRGRIMGILPLADYLYWLTEQQVLTIEDCHFSAQMLIEMTKGPLHTQALLLPNTVITDDEIRQQVHSAVDIFFKAHQI